MDAIIEEAGTYIKSAPYPLLVTVGEEDKPYARYIGPVVTDGLDVLFVTRIDSHKVKHIGLHPSVILYFQNADQTPKKFRSVAVSGKAHRISDEIDFNNALDKLGQKSPEYKNYIDKDGPLIWAIYQVTAVTLQYTDFAKSTRTITQKIHNI
jgi:general stress protein 26